MTLHRVRSVASTVALVLSGSLAVAHAASARAPEADGSNADGRSKHVVIVTDAALAPLALRLEQEIESLGLLVTTLSHDDPDVEAHERQALARGAFAAIHLAPSGGGGDVDLSMTDPTTGKSTSWKLAAPAGAASELLATRTVELLRASLLELAARPTATPEPAPPPVTTERPPAPPPAPAQPETGDGRLSLGVGPALLYGLHFRPGALLGATFTWLPVRHFGLSAGVLAPLVPLRLSSPQGSVALFATLYRLSGALEIGDVTSPILLRATLGIELDQLRFEGRPTSDYEGATDSLLAWSPYAAVAPRFRISPSWYVVPELAVGVATPKTVVRVAGREVTEWGRPVGTASLGLELVWPPATEP